MSAATVAVQVPRPLYQRLERLAKLTQQPIERLVAQALSSGLPPLPDDLDPTFREALIGFESLSDAELRAIESATFPRDRYETLAALRERQRTSTLLPAEQEALAALDAQADLLTLRKAYAAVLLKWRE